jgi:hypothetical protein
LNRKLDVEKAELAKNIERLKQKLDKAESLVFSMGTPEAIRQRGPVIPVVGSSADLFPRLFTSSSHGIVWAPDGTVQNLGEPVDLSVSPPEPGDIVMGTSAAPETSSAPMAKLSFKEVISSAQKQNSKNKNVAGTSEQPPPPRLITLSTLGSKNEDVIGKRTRSLGTVASKPAQKKPSQNSMASTSERAPLLFCWNSPAHGIKTRRRKLKKRSRSHARTFNGHAGHSPRT